MSARDTVLGQRSELAQRARQKGISLEDLDTILKGNPRAYATQLTTLINQAADTPGRYRLHSETPPAGAFDGANRTFSLAGVVLGRNIIVMHVTQATGSLLPLTLTDNPNPVAGTFYLDVLNNAAIVGLAPAASDHLIVVYLTRR